jgi:hypothetical protein
MQGGRAALAIWLPGWALSIQVQEKGLHPVDTAGLGSRKALALPGCLKCWNRRRGNEIQKGGIQV